MARLPTVGGDTGTWGTVLNEYLTESASLATLATSPSAGATTFDLAVVPGALRVGSIIAIDAYTTQCEIRSVGGIAGSTITVGALKFSHSSGDAVVVIDSLSGVSTDLFALAADATDEWQPLQRAVIETTALAVPLAGRAALIGRVFSVSQPICVPTSSIFRDIGMKTRTGYAPVDAAGALCMVSNRVWAFTAAASTNVFTVSGGHGMSSFSETNHTKIVFNAPYGETLPGGITSGKVYYIDTVPNGTTFTISATQGGAILDVTADGTGYGFESIEELARTYWDHVRFDLSVADVNGVRVSLQQPSHITDLRIEMDVNCTVRTYGLVVEGQLGAITNAEINPGGNNTTGVSMGGTGIAFANLNLVGNNTDTNYGLEVACWAGTITNLWTESCGIGVKIVGECRGFAIDGTWLVSSGAPNPIALQVDDAASAKASSYRVCPIKWGTGGQHVFSDVGRLIDLYGSGYATDPSKVATDFQGTYMGHVQEGQNSGSLGYLPPTLNHRSLVGVTTDYTARYIDSVVRVGTTGGARTVTLPTAVGWSGIDITVHHFAGSNSLTIDPPGAQTIDGSSTYVVPLGVAVRCVSDGTNWVIMGIGLPGQTQTYAASNVVTDRTYDANATTLDELADVLGTLISDLRARNLVA